MRRIVESAFLKDCIRLYAEGKCPEELIHYLRSRGCSKTESIAVISQVLEVDLVEAKKIVHLSATWADRKTSDEDFHESLERVSKVKKP